MQQLRENVQGTGAQVLCIRKTVPGLRLLDKWAVLIGGSPMHRIGLYDMVMIKDNHVAAAGGFHAALQGVQVNPSPDQLLTVGPLRERNPHQGNI